LFHMTYYYGFEAEHFVLTSGVLLKNRSSLHISLITDIFLKRRPIELIFLLYSIQVANPSPEAPAHERISSLARHNAIGLQDFLIDLIKETRVGPEFEQDKTRGSHLLRAVNN
ncbi:MAG: PH domain-containing protein, partial [Bdellovibrionales bacterium]|nr:PH domain-containing protein [Bdellovibrionales bacterium]